MSKVIEANELSFQYSENNLPALKPSTFSIEKGSIVFITGKSGSGKSSLLNIINGLIPEVLEGTLQGELKINHKKDLKIHERSLILGNVFQNPRSQFFTTNTSAELVFSMENYAFSKEEMQKRLEEITRKFHIEKLLDRDIFQLSSGERQLLALLTVLIMNPDVLIFDEPSANLDYGNTMRLRQQIQKLKAEGKTIVIAEHRCFYLRGIIDKVLLIEDKEIKSFDSEEAFLNCDYARRVFNLFQNDYETRSIEKSNIETLTLSNLSFLDILKNVSLKFRKNEVNVIIGTNGVGKTTLAKLMCKSLKPSSGEINAEGNILYIMQDADFQLFGSSCLNELAITNKNKEENLRALEHLHLDTKKNHHPQTLSGGEKQRLQMAISLVSQNPIIIFDEPTSGLDKNTMAQVVKMLESLKRNRTLIVISHDYEFIRNIADRIIYIKDKTIAEDFYLEEKNIEKLNTIYNEMEAFYTEKTQ